MEGNMDKATIENFCGLEYLTVHGCPVYNDPKYGQIIDIKPEAMEKFAAKIILNHMIPIRGKELKLLRSALGFSLEQFAREFQNASSTILRWEKAIDQRLDRSDEIAVRLFVAEKLDVSVPHTFSELTAFKKDVKDLHVELTAS